MNVKHKRQGQMDIASCYFYTDTIHDFKHLLKDDEFKTICINSWKYLVDNELIKIYGFVIMPNHIHLLWNMIKLNGKESPAGSFAKYTAHLFKKLLAKNDVNYLESFCSDKADRKYQFWKRDPLAIQITNEKNLLQKLEYIHNNPVKEKWMLVKTPEEYKWSSANFYASGLDDFGICTHYLD